MLWAIWVTKNGMRERKWEIEKTTESEDYYGVVRGVNTRLSIMNTSHLCIHTLYLYYELVAFKAEYRMRTIKYFKRAHTVGIL